jgi:hypothetical protein
MVMKAHTYAPILIKPACPRENWPVKPVTRFSPHARMIFTQTVTITVKI